MNLTKNPPARGQLLPFRNPEASIQTAVVATAVMVMLYSYALVAMRPLDAIPRVFYIPVFAFCIGLLLWNKWSFIIGIVLCCFLGTIGKASVQLMKGEIGARDLAFTFGSFNLGFVNLGLFNTSLVLCAYFMIRYHAQNLDLSIRRFLIPLLLLVFSVIQFFVYYQFAGLTLTTRAPVIFLFLALGIAYLSIEPVKMERIVRLVLFLIAVFSIFVTLRFLGSSEGRSGFVLSMIGFPLGLYYLKTRKPGLIFLALMVLGAVALNFLFWTFWTKLMILTSIASTLFALPLVQRHRFLFWALPIANMLLPISANFIQYDDEAAYMREMIMAQREEMSIADITEFNLGELYELAKSKYLAERNMLWRSSIAYTFDTIGLNTILPDPSGHFYFIDGPWRGELWLHGPHNAFLWFIRAYGVIAGILIYGYIYLLLFRIITQGCQRYSILHQVLQPFLLTYAALGPAIGDYSFHSAGAMLVFVLLGLALYLGNIEKQPRFNAA